MKFDGIICFEKHKCGNYPDECNNCPCNWKNVDWEKKGTKKIEIDVSPLSEALKFKSVGDIPRDYKEQVKEIFRILFKKISKKTIEITKTDSDALREGEEIIKEFLKEV